MKLSNVPNDWINTRPGIWHRPYLVKRGDKYNLERKIYYEKVCACGDKFLTPQIFRKYCTQLCANRHIKKFGKNHRRWKGGSCNTERGYILVMISRNPRKYKFQHRLIMEHYLGRTLTNNEVVHHIDGDTSNNDFNNLQLMTRQEHAHHHQIVKV